MQYVTYLSGHDMVGQIYDLNAKTVAAAKKEATQLLGMGFKHYKIQLDVRNSSGMLEPVAFRKISEKSWFSY
jgi:hypothetical protein